MNSTQILNGSSCFLVENIDEKSGENIVAFLEREGFEATEGISLPKINSVHANIESMKYGYAPLGVKIASNIVDEIPRNQFNIEEFKIIWHILRKHRKNRKKIESNNRKYLSIGYSCFIVKDIESENQGNDFISYLDNEKFESLDKDITPSKNLLINVLNMKYTNESSSNMISSYIKDNMETALNIDEFKTIWEIIRKHKSDEWKIENLREESESSYKSQNYENVVNKSEETLKLDNKNEIALENKASSLFKLKKYEEALETLNYAISNYPNNYKFYNLKAFILTDLYKIDEAITMFNRSFILGGFDTENRNKIYKCRAKCYLKKSREDYYIRKNVPEALKSLNIYLKEFPEDNEALKLKQELTNQYPFRYKNKLKYFENKANELYEFGYLKESYESYKEVLRASLDFKNNLKNETYIGYDIINRCTTHDLDNFRWYDEHLSRCLLDYSGNYEEFFKKLFEISSETIEICLDKAKFYSKTSDEKITEEYTEKLLKKCPSNEEVKKFHNQLCYIRNVYNIANTCDVFKDYNDINEYIEDLIPCIIANFSYYDEETARNAVNRSKDLVEKAYENKWPAGEVSWDFVIF